MFTSLRSKIVGATAAVALAAGIGAATAAPADAATVWDRVAQCESGGRWHINTGNGYYGGLQFSAATWRGYGGKAYASQASRATKAQQIAIARRVLAAQGPRAWPVCGPRAGLTRASGGANAHATAGRSQTVYKSTKAVTVVKSVSLSGRKTVTVKRGDTLAKLAHRYHVRGGWRGLWQLNKSRVHNPNLIRVGAVLVIR
jgi:nucleoid-associated protein YgaU